MEELPNILLAEDLNVAFPLSFWVTRAHAAPAAGDRNLPGDYPAELVQVDPTHVIWPRNTEYEIFSLGASGDISGSRHGVHAGNRPEWDREGALRVYPYGSLNLERVLPNGIAFGTRVIPGRDAVRMETCHPGPSTGGGGGARAGRARRPRRIGGISPTGGRTG